MYKFEDYEPFICKFSFGTYKICGNPDEIIQIINTYGILNISMQDVFNTLSSKNINYVLTNYGNGKDRIWQALDTILSKLEGSFSNILINLWSPYGDNTIHAEEIGQFTKYLKKKLPDIKDIIWGVSIDKDLTDNIKVTLIASNK